MFAPITKLKERVDCGYAFIQLIPLVSQASTSIPQLDMALIQGRGVHFLGSRELNMGAGSIPAPACADVIDQRFAKLGSKATAFALTLVFFRSLFIGAHRFDRHARNNELFCFALWFFHNKRRFRRG